MDPTIVAAIITAIGAVLAIVLRRAEEVSRLHSLERLAKLLRRLAADNRVDRNLEELAAVMAKQLLEYYDFPPWLTCLNFAVATGLVALAAFVLRAIPGAFPHVSRQSIDLVLNWVAYPALAFTLILAVLAAAFLLSRRENRMARKRAEHRARRPGRVPAENDRLAL